MRNYPESNEKNTPVGSGSRHQPIPRSMTYLILFAVLFALLVTVMAGIRVARQRVRVSILPEEETEGQGGSSGSNPPIFAGGAYAAYPTRAAGYAEQETGVTSSYLALLNTKTGEILAGKNTDTRFAPASMTKIMTMLVLCEHLTESDLDRRVNLTQEIYDTVHPRSGGYVGADSYFSNAYIGCEITLRTALYGIGVSSKADCTLMAVLQVSESEEAFVELMNAEVSAMGLTDTHFDNIIGYESDDNYTTATEMSAILARALQCDLIREILSTPSYDQFEIFDPMEQRTYNKNYFYSTLFNVNGKGNRFADAGIGVGGKLTLQKATFGGGKTGSLEFNKVWKYSLASFATAKDGTVYVLVTGEATKGGVISDAKAIFDQYIS